jgi:DNA-binding transcriptional LysR family regulator
MSEEKTSTSGDGLDRTASLRRVGEWGMSPWIEIKLFRAAVALAEELHMTRAGDKIGITQSAMSKRVDNLEDQLGIQLFNRGLGQIVTITPQGEVFVAEAKIILEQCQRSVHLTRAASDGAEIVLHVGKSPYTDPFLLTNLLSLHLPLFPGLRVEVTSRLAVDLSHELLNGSLDLAFLTGMPETQRISSLSVASLPFFVALLEQDELASYRSISGEQLKSRSCILFDRRVHPYLYEKVSRAVRPASAHGTILHHVMTAEEASHLVLRGLGVALLTQAGAWRIARNGITIRPLDDQNLKVETRLACRSDNRMPVVSHFVKSFMRKLQRSHQERQMNLGLAM